ncbi:MAG: serine/threonine protein kinase [Planctomycetes bacterium]|nr:serine/threonine protein kinase [Planctomycetota bacterium]
MNEASCPPDEEFIAAASGKGASLAFKEHLRNCPRCQLRLESYHASLSGHAREVSGGFGSTSDFGLDDLLTRLAGMAKGSASREQAESHPASIGKYKVIAYLGGGGQAKAYRAFHPELEKDVVIKISILTVDENPQVLSRLKHEAQLLAGFDHPQLVRVYDLGLHEGRPFIVLDHIQGRTLRQVAENDRLPPRIAARHLASIARAVSAAHRKGVIHRDIKPENVILDERDGQSKLIDFGIAQLRWIWSEEKEQLGLVSGTVGYMAPEQARGETERIGPRTDIFGLGGTLYFLLAGKAPYEAQNPEDVLEHARRCEFDRLALMKARVPGRLKKICLKAMAKEPVERYAGAERLAADLEAFVRLPRFLLWAAGVLLLVVLLGLGSWHLLGQFGVLFGSAWLEPEMRLEIIRPDRGSVPLHEALPLTKGDQVVLHAILPVEGGDHAAFYWLNSRGELRELSPVKFPSPNYVILTYPFKASEFASQRGTEFLFVGASRTSRPETREIKSLLALNGPLPELLPRAAWHLKGDRVEPSGDRGSSSDKKLVEGASRRIEVLRRQLVKRLEWVDGWVFRRE